MSVGFRGAAARRRRWSCSAFCRRRRSRGHCPIRSIFRVQSAPPGVAKVFSRPRAAELPERCWVAVMRSRHGTHRWPSLKFNMLFSHLRHAEAVSRVSRYLPRVRRHRTRCRQSPRVRWEGAMPSAWSEAEPALQSSGAGSGTKGKSRPMIPNRRLLPICALIRLTSSSAARQSVAHRLCQLWEQVPFDVANVEASIVRALPRAGLWELAEVDGRGDAVGRHTFRLYRFSARR